MKPEARACPALSTKPVGFRESRGQSFCPVSSLSMICFQRVKIVWYPVLHALFVTQRTRETEVLEGRLYFPIRSSGAPSMTSLQFSVIQHHGADSQTFVRIYEYIE